MLYSACATSYSDLRDNVKEIAGTLVFQHERIGQLTDCVQKLSQENARLNRHVCVLSAAWAAVFVADLVSSFFQYRARQAQGCDRREAHAGREEDGNTPYDE
jgi:hypothetical protein